MIVFVEGNEGTGKTTLIDELFKTLPVMSAKCSMNFGNPFDLYYTLSNNKNIYLFDRGFITDIVYRRLDGNKGKMTLSEIGELCKTQEDNIKIIFCWNYNSFKRSMERGEDNITNEENHNLITKEFESVKNIIKCFTNIKYFDYDYEYDSVEDVINFIKGE